MPKAFDGKDKVAIRRALMAAGLKAFSRGGVRRARIEDICRAAGIAKGSFYAFFPGKEELFMQIAEEREARHRKDMLAFVTAPATDARDHAGGFFDLLVRKIETDPVLALVTEHEEIAYLARKLGPDRMRQGEEGDRAFVEDVAGRWAGGAIAADDLLGLMTIMLALVTSRRGMTEGQYRPALALLRELFVDRLAGATR